LKPHGYLLYLNRPVYLAVVRLQAKLGLGRSYSVLLPLVEGLHSMGYLSDEDYEEAKAQYSVGLIEANRKPPTLNQIREKEELERLEKHYSEVLAQWSKLNEKTRLVHLKKAVKDAKRVKAAKLVLDLADPTLEASVKEDSY
jgi:hypothetical protein